jgi:diguanylate cyclase (GGDEF)-like protein
MMTFGPSGCPEIQVSMEGKLGSGGNGVKLRRGRSRPVVAEDTDVTVARNVSTPLRVSREASSAVGSVESMFQQISVATAGMPKSIGGEVRQSGYDELWQLSLADPSTGLANKVLLLDRLAQALKRRQRYGGQIVVFHLGLTNLADVNHELGYTMGNAVLVELTRRVTALLRAEDTVGRVGGSELVAVASMGDALDVDPLTHRLSAVFEDPVSVAGETVRLSVSLGIAIAGEDESPEDILARAGRAASTGTNGNGPNGNGPTRR